MKRTTLNHHPSQVGVAGPLLLDRKEYTVPMATTEGCLVASTNRYCKAIFVSGGASSMLLHDGMTRAPVVGFSSAKRASQLKLYLEDPLNFDFLALTFNKSSRFARLQSIKAAVAGKNLYIRFSCTIHGDEHGNHLVQGGVFPDDLYNTVCKQEVEIVLTAHPAQITLQYKHIRIVHLLGYNDRLDLRLED